MIACDGCGTEYKGDTLRFFKSLGHMMRYCEVCSEVWVAFDTACKAEEARLQRQLDLFTQETRMKVPLKLTPQDLPQLVLDPKSGDVVTLA